MPPERPLLPLDVMRQLYQLADRDDAAVSPEAGLRDALGTLPYKRWFGPGQFGSGPGRAGRRGKAEGLQQKP